MNIQRKSFAIYDAAAEAYSDSFNHDTVGLAMRFFQDLLDNEASPYHKYPESYTLFYLGTYNLGNAKHKQDKAPLMIMTGANGPCVDASDQDFERDLSVKEA